MGDGTEIRTPPTPGRSRVRLGLGGHTERMETALWILVAVLIVLPAVVALALFVWAAIHDGREDRALQARLGSRRRTRLGR